MTSLIKYFFHLNAWFHHLKIIRSQLNVIVLNILDMLTILITLGDLGLSNYVLILPKQLH